MTQSSAGFRRWCSRLFLFCFVSVVLFSNVAHAESSAIELWTNQDVGRVGKAGSATIEGDLFSVSGSGADIWGRTDAFQFVYQSLPANGEIVARIATIQGTHTFAKAGLMIRESLDANARHASIVVTPGSGVSFMRRLNSGAQTKSVSGGKSKAPVWLKLSRSGNEVQAFVSSDGVRWKLVGSDSVSFAGQALVGLVVCSHQTHVLNASTFDHVSVKGATFVDADHDGLADAWELHYFGNLNQSGDDDFDHDGVSNRQEFLNGTDPAKANSSTATSTAAAKAAVGITAVTIPPSWPLYVYKDAEGPYAPSGYFGDTTSLVLDDANQTTPGQGFACVRIQYSGAGAQGFAGVYWQNPANNFGTIDGGLNLTGATKLKFMARGQVGGEKIQFLAGGITGAFADTFSVTPLSVTLTSAWQNYEIDLAGKNLTRVIGGFAFVVAKTDYPTGGTVFVDNVRYDNGSVTPTFPALPTPPTWPFYIFKDSEGSYAPSGYFGDTSDVVITDTDTINPGEGFADIKVQYTPTGPNTFAGVYWLNPANNFGTLTNGGFNLTGALKLKFMARASVAGAKVQFVAGGVTGSYQTSFNFQDTFKSALPLTTLTTAWQNFEIDLAGKDLSRVVGAFAFAMSKADNPTGATVFFDNIRYDNGTVSTPPVLPTPPSWPFYIYKDVEGPYAPSGFFGDFNSLTFSDTDTAAPGEGAQNIKIQYNAATSTNGFAGVYWLNPANNFGTVSNGGYNLTGATTLNFMAKASANGVKATITGGGVTGAYPDSFLVQTNITLTTSWQTFQVSLAGKDVSRVIGAFAFTLAKVDNPAGATLFLDNIYYNNGSVIPTRPPSPVPASWPVYVYKDTSVSYVPSGFFGDVTSLTVADDTNNPGEGFQSFRVQYSGAGTNGFAGIFWQNPANNFGTVSNGGFNLTGATKLKFMARAAVAGTKVQFQGGGIAGTFPDTYKSQTAVLSLTTAWQSFEIDLAGKDLTHVLGGFAFTVTKTDNPLGGTFFVDNIYYDNGTVPPVRPPSPLPASWPVNIYTDAHDKYLPTGFMGDVNTLTFTDTDTTNPQEGLKSIKIVYNTTFSTNNFAGVYWQNPADNWGTVSNGGLNLTGATKLRFFARGGAPGVKATFISGGIVGTYPDTYKSQTSLLTLTTAWQEYEIDLTGKDMTHALGGFAFTVTKADNPTGGTIYLDNIRILNTPTLPILRPVPGSWPFYIYKDSVDQYTSSVVGDTGDFLIDENDVTNPGEGTKSIKVQYSAAASSGQGFGVAIWQNPKDGFGSDPNGGFNLRAAKKMKFMARGKVGGETVIFLLGGLVGAPYGDTLFTTGQVTLTTAWQSFEFDLTGLDLSRVVDAFGVGLVQAQNPAGATVYVDNMRYDNGITTPLPTPASWPFYIYRDGVDQYFPTVVGDIGDMGASEETVNPGEGTKCVRFTYSGAVSAGQGFAVVPFVNPANNLGTDPNGGYNLTGARRVKFQARGLVGGEQFVVLAGGVDGPYGDNFKVLSSILTVGTAWQDFEIDLTGQELGRVVDGFAIGFLKSLSPSGATVFIDSVRYENGSISVPTLPTPASWPFYIYKDSHDKYAPSGYMGDIVGLTLDDAVLTNTGGGFACISVQYTPSSPTAPAFGGIYWQNPANNWGTNSTAGYNLTGALKVKFQARGQIGGEKVQFISGGIAGTYGDTYQVTGPTVTLTTAWQNFELNLAGQNLTRVVGGFAFAATKADNPTGAKFYLDNIYFDNGTPPPVDPPPGPVQTLPLFIYKDAHDKYGPTGWMGDVTSLTFSDSDTTSPKEGFNSIKIAYSGIGGNGFAGIYWQNPNGNWGTLTNGGLNLTGGKAVHFWAKGQVGGEKVQFISGGIVGPYGDTYKSQGPVVTLTSAWQQYTLDLTGKDLTRVVGGFAFVLNKTDNPSGATFYLDYIDVDTGTAPTITPPPPPPPQTVLPLVIFGDAHDKYGPTGWMGDYTDLTFSDTDTSNPGEGTKSIKIVYSGDATLGNNWSGIYWQNPNGNWGTVTNGGLNLTGATTIKFLARGQVGGEKVQFIAGGISGPYPDSFKTVTPVITLTSAWQQYQMSVAGKDLTRVVGGFCCVFNKTDNPSGATFYLDNIRYE